MPPVKRRNEMRKILAEFRKNPTLANEMRLRVYLSKHPMAVVVAPLEDYEFLKQTGIIK